MKSPLFDTGVLKVDQGTNIATEVGVFIGTKRIMIRLDGIAYATWVRQTDALDDSRQLVTMMTAIDWQKKCSPGIIMKVTAFLAREGYL